MEATWDTLWGSTLEELQIDLLQGSVSLGVVVTRGDQANRYRIEASGVSVFRYFNEIELPWTYAELAELHVDKSDGRVAIEAVLWTERAGIQIEALEARLTSA